MLKGYMTYEISKTSSDLILIYSGTSFISGIFVVLHNALFIEMQEKVCSFLDKRIYMYKEKLHKENLKFVYWKLSASYASSLFNTYNNNKRQGQRNQSRDMNEKCKNKKK